MADAKTAETSRKVAYVVSGQKGESGIAKADSKDKADSASDKPRKKPIRSPATTQASYGNLKTFRTRTPSNGNRREADEVNAATDKAMPTRPTIPLNVSVKPKSGAKFDLS